MQPLKHMLFFALFFIFRHIHLLLHYFYVFRILCKVTYYIFKKKKETHFKIIISLQKSVKISLRPEKPTEAEQEMFLGEYGFFIAVNSSNPENGGDVEDNQADIRIPLTVTTDWKVLGSSEPASLEYNISDPFPDKYLVEDQIGTY